jgi:hypothetical protein
MTSQALPAHPQGPDIYLHLFPVSSTWSSVYPQMCFSNTRGTLNTYVSSRQGPGASLDQSVVHSCLGKEQSLSSDDQLQSRREARAQKQYCLPLKMSY